MQQDEHTIHLVVIFFGLCFVSAGLGAAVAVEKGGSDVTAPDCSTVFYQGNGTAQHPYEVSTLDQLQCLDENDRNATYEQVTDINASETAGWNNGNGFAPLTESSGSDPAFGGTFDGTNHVITNLTIRRSPQGGIGLFEATTETGVLRDITLVNASIVGQDTVGGIVGRNGGTVNRSSVSGTVTGSFFNIGGITGNNTGTVTRSYAVSNVTGSSIVGGLAGSNSGTVTRSYAAGNVTGSDFVGGLVGIDVIDSSLDRLYWDRNATGQDDPSHSEDFGTGLTTPEMTGAAAEENMSGLDFNTTWTTVSDGYPELLPPNFQFDDLSPVNATVLNRSTVDILASVINTGGRSGTQAVTLSVGGLTRTQNATVATGEQVTVTFSVDTGQLGPGTYTHEVTTRNDSANGTLTVEEGPEEPTFRVSDLTPANATVGNGTLVNISAAIENVGNQSGTQSIEFSLDGVNATRNLTLDRGERRTVTFGLDTGQVGPGEYTHQIASANTSANGTLTVRAVPDFQLSNLDPASAVLENGTVFDISARVENTGEANGARVVTLSVGDVEMSRNLTLSAGENSTVSFNFDTEQVGVGNYTHEVSSANDSVNGTVVVEPRPTAATFNVNSLDPAETTLGNGTNLRVSAEIENIGEQNGTQAVTLSVDGLGETQMPLSLAGRETTTVDFDPLYTGPLDPGTYAYEVTTNNDTRDGTLALLSRGDITAPNCGNITYQGNGTPTAPYEVRTVDQLQCIGNSAAYEQVVDIDATGTHRWNNGTGFEPVNSFSGTYDGNGHKIVGLTVTREQYNIGLFGRIEGSGVVTDAHLRDVNITISYAPGGYDSFGGIAGINTGTIRNSSATGRVVARGPDLDRVGGLVGQNNGDIRQSTAAVRVHGSNSVGGLVGIYRFEGAVIESHATGRVSGNSNVGGLVGLLDEAQVERSYATGPVTGNTYTGGLVGFTGQDGTIRSSYATGKVTAGGFSGGLVGFQEGSVRNSYATGNVTGDIAGGLAGSFTGSAIRDSHATGQVTASGSGGGLVGETSGGAAVIGSYATGNVSASKTGGLVGVNGVGSSATIRGSYATGRVDGSGVTGGLVGDNSFGTVVESHATGRVIGEDRTGGLVGVNANGGTIRRSYATGSVSGTKSVGGLVGDNNLNSPINQSYATGSVSGVDQVGGLVGVHRGTLARSYAVGGVSGDQRTGGLVGRTADQDAETERSYWDNQTTGQDESAGGTALTTAEMTGDAPLGTMEFDFDGTWTTLPDDYPVLLSVPVGAQLPPRPALNRRPLSPVVGENVTFDASRSVDLNGDPLTYGWDFGADNTTDATGATVSRTYETNGTRQVSLTVSGGNLSANLSETVEVYRASVVPNASFTADGPKLNSSNGTLTVPVGVPVRFNASASNASGNRSLEAYTWSFGPGETATGETVLHRFPKAGTHTVRLRVTDSANVTDTARQMVNVTEPDDPVIFNITQPANGIIPQSDSPVFGIPNTWRVNAASDDLIAEVTFEFPSSTGGFTRTDTTPEDGWTAQLTPADLNFDLADGNLEITAEDESGNTTERAVEIKTFDLPNWGAPYIISDSPALPGSNDTLEGGIRIGPPTVGFPLVVDIEIDASVRPSVVHQLGTRQAQLGGEGKLGFTAIPPIGPGVGATGTLSVDANATIEDDRLRVKQVTVKGSAQPKVILVILAVNTPVGEFQVTGSVSGGPGLEAQLNTTGNLSIDSGELSGKTTVTPLKISAGANVGPVTILSTSVGGKVSGTGAVDVSAGGINGTLTGAGKLFAKLQAVGFRFKKEVGPSETIPVFNITGTDGWQQVDKRSARPDRPAGDARSATATNSETTRLTNNTLADRTPAIAAADDETTVLWAAQDPNLTTLNGTELVVRRGVQNATTQQVTDDKRYDTSPSLVTLTSEADTIADATRGVAWSRARAPIDNDTFDGPMDLLSELETHVGVLNRSTSELSSTRLTNDSVPDIETTVAGLGTDNSSTPDAWLVAWVEESDANLTTTADRRVEYAVLGPEMDTVRTRGNIPNATAIDTTTAGQRVVLVAQTNATGTPGVRRVAFAPNGSRLGETNYIAPTAAAVTAAGETTAWTAGTGGQQRIHTRTNDRNHTLRNVPVSAAGIELSQAGDRQVLSYRARTDGPNSTKVFTHTRTTTAGEVTNWSQAHPVQTGEIPLRRAAVTATPESVTTVFESTPNLSTRADIVAASQPYAEPNLTVTAHSEDVGLAAGSVVATVTNTGGQAATERTLTIETPAGDSTTLSVPALTPGERVTRELSIAKPLAGVARATIADPSGGEPAIDDRARANFTADVFLGNVRDRLTDDRSTLIISADLVNTGPLPARNVPYRVEIGNQTVNNTLDALAVNRTQTISAQVDADDIDTGDVATVTVAPNGTVPDPAPGDSRRQGPVRQLDTGVVGNLQAGTPASGYGQPVGMMLLSGDTGAPVARVEVNATDGTQTGTGAVYEVPLPAARSASDAAHTPVRLAVPSIPDNGSLDVATSPQQAPDTDLTNGLASGTVGDPTDLGPHLTVTDAEAALNGSDLVALLELHNPSDSVLGELVRATGPNGTQRVPTVLRPGEQRWVEIPVPAENASNVTIQTVKETVTLMGSQRGAFLVDITGADDPVAGENLTVTAEITNTGETEYTQTIALDVPDIGTTETDVTLPGNASTAETLALDTGAGDAGTYTATVSTANDTDTTNVTVLDGATLAVEIVDAPDVVEGDPLTVTANITNTGDLEDTQSVTLDIGALGSASTQLTLAAGASTETTLSVGTEEGDAGTYTATVATEDDEDSVPIEVSGDATVQIVSVDAPPVVEGEVLDVTATVENVGETAGTSAVSAAIDGVGENSTAVTLGAGESTTVTLAVDTDIGDAGEYTVAVETPQDALATTTELMLPALPNQDGPPQDPDGDDRYEDTDGDGTFDIFDVQTLFVSLDSELVDEHGWAFDFDDDGDVTIFDVQAQFNGLT